MNSPNPLLQPTTWSTPFQIPPFEAIRTEHFTPAFEQSMKAHLSEVETIAQQKEAATFQNTVTALELSGQWLQAVAAVFYNLTGAETSPELQNVEAEFSPKWARHWTSISLNAPLFARVSALYDTRKNLGLTPEEIRVLERIYTDFIQSGAKLEGAARTRFEALTAELAELETQFSQRVVRDMAASQLVLERAEDLQGLPPSFVQAAEQAGASPDKKRWVFRLNEPTVTTFITHSERRALREQFWKLWKHRGENTAENTTTTLIGKILQGRQEKARLLGYPDYSHFALDHTMAAKPQAALELLHRVWEPARQKANADREAMSRLASTETGTSFTIEEWDWAFYAEKVRKARFDLDESEIKPYFPLPRMIDAAFDVATRLFGVHFKELPNAPRYHPDVRTWEVLDAQGAHVGIFLGDYYARPSKRSGAWMSNYRDQFAVGALQQRPIIVNVCNFTAPARPEEPCLLSLDELRTLFHEFGHGLHGLLSRCHYPRVSGTNVLRDFVEFPSQLYEHWAREPQLLSRYARHVKTGEAIPAALQEKIKNASQFNQAFGTVEYTASALADLKLHSLPSLEGFDPTAFESQFLKEIQMPAGIKLRHRLPQFLHAFSSEGYSSKYYVYLWAGVLDADGYGAFEEAGDPYAPGPAKRLLENVYAAGNSKDPMEAYRAFRGREPSVEPLLKQRGLLDVH